MKFITIAKVEIVGSKVIPKEEKFKSTHKNTVGEDSPRRQKLTECILQDNP